MKTCPKCKVDVLDDEAKFCVECGAALTFDSVENNFEEIPTPSERFDMPKKKSTILLSRKPKIPALKSGQNLNLTKLISENLPLFVNISWNCTKKFALDFTAFLTNSKGVIVDDDDVVFYNNPIHPTNCVELVDDGVNAKHFKIALKKIPADIFKISFVLSIDDEDEEQSFDEFSAEEETNEQTFENVNSICVTVYNDDKKILEYNLENIYSGANALIVGEIYQRDEVFTFGALDEKFTDGLAEVCEKFGLEVQ